MKILKRIFKVISIIIAALFLFVVAVFLIDFSKTSYLKISNNESLQNQTYIIKNVHIIPMTKDTVLRNKMLLLKDGIITSISDELPEDQVETIDAKGQFLSPGLIDMHVHVWDKYELGLYLSQGVTAVRNLWGLPMHLRLKDAIIADKIIAPLFFVSSPKLTGPNDLGDDKVQLTSLKEAKDKVISYKERGYDFIKTYAGLPEDYLNTIIEQAILSDIKIVSHPSFEIEYIKHFNPQIASIEHAEDIVQQPLKYQLDSIQLAKVVKMYATSNTSFSPTLTGYYKIFEMMNNQNILETKMARMINPLLFEVDSKGQFARWSGEKEGNNEIVSSIERQHKFHLYALKKLHEAKVNIVASTDAGIGITAPGYALHQELSLYKEAGLSNYEVLKTATVNPGKAHKEFQQMGSIIEGKLANFVLTTKNPLEDLTTLSKPVWTMVKGRRIDQNTMQQFEEKAMDRNNFLVTAFRYLEYLLIER